MIRLTYGVILLLTGGLLLGFGLIHGAYAITQWAVQGVSSGWRPDASGLGAGLGLAMLLIGMSMLRSALRTLETEKRDPLLARGTRRG